MTPALIEILPGAQLRQMDRQQLDRSTLERRAGLQSFPAGVHQPQPDPTADWVRRELAVNWRRRR